MHCLAFCLLRRLDRYQSKAACLGGQEGLASALQSQSPASDELIGTVSSQLLLDENQMNAAPLS